MQSLSDTKAINADVDRANGITEPIINEIDSSLESVSNSSGLRVDGSGAESGGGDDGTSGRAESSVDIPAQHPSDNEGVKFADLDDTDSICSSGSRDPEIPDGGWGWVVVASSFLISMIADGISFSFGLLYIEFLEEFEASKSKTAWIGSLFIAVPLLSGPVMSALVDRYGCRSMTMLGGAVATLGFALASLARTIELMFLTFGVIAGLGLGLVYVTAVVSITYWFDSKRTLAVGLGACGTGVGTFLYAPLTQYFLDEYGWRGTILLLAGTMLNLCVCGSVMRDPAWWVREQRRQAESPRKRSAQLETLSARSGGAESMFPGAEELRSLMRSGQAPECILTQLAASIYLADSLDTATKINAELLTKANSAVQLPTFIEHSEKVPIEVLEVLSSNKRLYNIILENYPSLLTFRSSSEQHLPNEPLASQTPVTMQMKLKATKRIKQTEKEEVGFQDGALVTLLPAEGAEAARPALVKQDSAKTAAERREWLRKQFSLNNHYFRDVRAHRNSLAQRDKYRLRASSCPNIYKNSAVTIVHDEQKWYVSAWEVVSDVFDFSLFLELHFLLMSAATVLLFVWFIVPYFYLAEHMTRHHYDEEDAAQLISVIGITSTIGMVTLGWAGDRPWLDVRKAYAACLVLCGACAGAFPLLTPHYPLLLLNSALFGLFFASTFSFTPGILVELVPLENFTTAYGLILLCQGIGHLIGPPLSGLIFDMTGHWELSFYLAGLWIALAGVLVALIPLSDNVTLCGRAGTAHPV